MFEINEESIQCKIIYHFDNLDTFLAPNILRMRSARFTRRSGRCDYKKQEFRNL